MHLEENLLLVVNLIKNILYFLESILTIKIKIGKVFVALPIFCFLLLSWVIKEDEDVEDVQ